MKTHYQWFTLLLTPEIRTPFKKRTNDVLLDGLLIQTPGCVFVCLCVARETSGGVSGCVQWSNWLGQFFCENAPPTIPLLVSLGSFVSFFT